ncbi:MAG: hypothetical protein QXU96_09170 [Ignisphaera sp.]
MREVLNKEEKLRIVRRVRNARMEVDTVRKHYPQKKVMGILAGSLIEREVEVYAREKNIPKYAY